jgi:hypothetical protein
MKAGRPHSSEGRAARHSTQVCADGSPAAINSLDFVPHIHRFTAINKAFLNANCILKFQ